MNAVFYKALEVSYTRGMSRFYHTISNSCSTYLFRDIIDKAFEEQSVHLHPVGIITNLPFVADLLIDQPLDPYFLPSYLRARGLRNVALPNFDKDHVDI